MVNLFFLSTIVVGKVGVPKQLVIEDLLSIPDEVRKAGLKLPLGIHSWCIFHLLCKHADSSFEQYENLGYKTFLLVGAIIWP